MGARLGALFGPWGVIVGAAAGGATAYTMNNPGKVGNFFGNMGLADAGYNTMPAKQGDVPYRGLIQESMRNGGGIERVTVTGYRQQNAGWAPPKEQQAALERYKAAFQDYLGDLEESTRLAKLSTAEQQESAAVIKAAELSQRAQGVAAEKVQHSYEESVRWLRQQGELTKVLALVEDGRSSSLTQQNARSKDELQILRLQLSLVGRTNMEQAKALALLKVQQDLKARYGKGFDAQAPTKEQQETINLAVQQAAATVTLTESQQQLNDELYRTSSIFSQINQSAQVAAAGMAGDFEELPADVISSTAIRAEVAKNLKEIFA